MRKSGILMLPVFFSSAIFFSRNFNCTHHPHIVKAEFDNFFYTLLAALLNPDFCLSLIKSKDAFVCELDTTWRVNQWQQLLETCCFKFCVLSNLLRGFCYFHLQRYFGNPVVHIQLTQFVEADKSIGEFSVKEQASLPKRKWAQARSVSSDS